MAFVLAPIFINDEAVVEPLVGPDEPLGDFLDAYATAGGGLWVSSAALLRDSAEVAMSALSSREAVRARPAPVLRLGLDLAAAAIEEEVAPETEPDSFLK